MFCLLFSSSFLVLLVVWFCGFFLVFWLPGFLFSPVFVYSSFSSCFPGFLVCLFFLVFLVSWFCGLLVFRFPGFVWFSGVWLSGFWFLWFFILVFFFFSGFSGFLAFSVLRFFGFLASGVLGFVAFAVLVFRFSSSPILWFCGTCLSRFGCFRVFGLCRLSGLLVFWFSGCLVFRFSAVLVFRFSSVLIS